MVTEVKKPKSDSEENEHRPGEEGEERRVAGDPAEAGEGSDSTSPSETQSDAGHGDDFNEIVGATTRTVHEDITRFLDTFERSARRWEMVVYPAMFAFIILAGYGFFLIYSLTNNMNTIAQSFDPNMANNMARLATNMDEMTANVAQMTDEIHNMSREIKMISGQMGYLAAMKPISEQMAQMDFSIRHMSNNFEMMRYDMNTVSRDIHDISRPMNMIDRFVPW